MRLLLATPDYPPALGGIQLLLGRLVEHSRHEYEVVTLGDARRQRLGDGAGAAVKEVPCPIGRRPGIALLNFAAFARALAARPDAVLAGHLVTGPGAMAVQRLLGSPAIQFLYSLELAQRPGLTRRITSRASASIAISSHTRDQALSSGAAAERLHLIAPGVDQANGAPPCDSEAKRQPTVITVARLEDRYKGFDVMIRSLPLVRAQVPEARWLVVGDGSLRPELESMAASLDVLQSVDFAGAVDDARRDACLARADVFAMPSRLLPGGLGGEGFGIAYLEAATHGLPSVAGNVGGSTDAVIDGKTGLLVDPLDHVAVADAIARLLLDRELRARLGNAARARAAQLSWSRMASQVDDLVERVIESAR